MTLRVFIQTLMCAALVLANGEQLSSATTLSSDLKVSLIIADHCSISTDASLPAVLCDGSGVYRVYEGAPFAAVPVSEDEPAAQSTESGGSASSSFSTPPRQKIEIAF